MKKLAKIIHLGTRLSPSKLPPINQEKHAINSLESLLNSFQYQEFMSSVAGHTKDKQGHNISILILEYLHLLKNEEFEQLCSKEDSLRKYAHSYLKTEHSKRSFYFFKLMLLVIRADFDHEKRSRKGNLWLEKLKKTPEPGDAYAVAEIIPYEKLWEIILELLER